MKKSLFAVAALSAIAGVAQAQSSVTVYGILDVGINSGNSRLAPGAASNSAAATVSRATGVAISGGGQQTNRIGFKGTEDLGGGLSAFFTIEQAIAPNGDSAFANSGNMNRQTFAGLKKAGLGDFAIGTQYTPLHNAVAATDAGGTNNILGDVIYVASSMPSSTTIPAGTATANYDNMDTNVGYTVRTKNTLQVNSATLAGFQAHAMFVASNNNSNVTQYVPSTSTTGNVAGGVNNNNGWGLGLDYTWNKLFATANYQSLTSKNPYDLTTTYAINTSSGATKTVAGAVGTPSIWGLVGSNAFGSNVQDNQGYIAATYDFGILKAYGQWVTRKVSSQLDSNQYLKRQAQQIGVRSFITPTIEAWASAGNGKVTAYGLNNPSANFTGYQVGSNYWLSKRTNFYAIYGAANTSNVAVSATTGFASANANNYSVGLRHTF